MYLKRASTVESNRDDCWMYKNRKKYSKERAGNAFERTQGIKKIIDEIKLRKERDLGDG